MRSKGKLAKATLPPPPRSDVEKLSAEAPFSPPPLAWPDRQLTYGGTSHYEWPPPEHDHNTITIDRIRDDIDGPAHRFVIKRGDSVEVFLSRDRLEVGEVTGINHRNQKVQVSLREGSMGVWFAKEQVYPVPEDAPTQPRKTKDSPFPGVATAKKKPDEGLREADEVPRPAEVQQSQSNEYSLAAFREFRRQLAEGSLTFNNYQEHFEQLIGAKDSLPTALKSQFNAKELATLASRMGSWDAKRSTKDQNAVAVYRHMLSAFVLERTISYSMGTSFEEAVIAKVRSYTLKDFVDAHGRELAKRDERTRALGDPRTFFEFRTFLQEKCEDDLTDDQLARYDALHSDMTRDGRAAKRESTITAFQSDELAGYEFQIKEGYHDKRQCPVWIVQLTDRVERPAFDELNRKAKMLGGWYSSFKKSDSGFQFVEREKAERFTALLQGSVDRSDVLDVRKERKAQTAAERLHDLAGALAMKAEEAIEASNESLQNTARRADIQAGVRGRAHADAALARTIHSIAEALSRGEAKYLDGIRHKSQVETLDMLLRVAKFARLRQTRHPGDETERQPNLLDARYADYPYPTLYRQHLENAIVKCQVTKGAKQTAKQMTKRLRRENEDYVTFRDEYDIEALVDFVGRLKTLHHDTEVFGWALEKHQRLQRAGITDIHELRSALREYLFHRAESRGDDPVKVAERELIGKKLPGFFPTPRPVIERVLALAGIEPAHRVLEPSCGKGDIVDAIKSEHPGASLHAIEINRTLADILSAKGYEVEFVDFLEHQEIYDRIVMNPPFENGQDIDHIRHAFGLLAPGGRLVSVISEGPFFRVDNKSVAFRDWLDKRGANVEQLPDDAFTGVEAFRETSVRTRLVTITKEADA